jgi:hypothetical protein
VECWLASTVACSLSLNIGRVRSSSVPGSDAVWSMWRACEVVGVSMGGASGVLIEHELSTTGLDQTVAFSIGCEGSSRSAGVTSLSEKLRSRRRVVGFEPRSLRSRHERRGKESDRCGLDERLVGTTHAPVAPVARTRCATGARRGASTRGPQ